MTIIQRVGKILGCPLLLSSQELHKMIEDQKNRKRVRSALAKNTNDVIRDWVHGINADTQREIAKRDE